jgi:hypothetical protein
MEFDYVIVINKIIQAVIKILVIGIFKHTTHIQFIRTSNNL